MGGYCCTSNFILGLSYSCRFAFTSQCSMFLPLFTPLKLSLHTDPLPRCPGILVDVLVSSLSQSLPCCVFPFTLKNNDSGLLLISYSPEIAFFFFSCLASLSALECVFPSCQSILGHVWVVQYCPCVFPLNPASADLP
jgi:hypothetical protein